MTILVATGGCGGGPSTPAAPAPTQGPHSGIIAPLPGGAGFAELLVEPAEGDQARLVAYFLQPDGKSPLPGGPTSATVAVKLPDGTTPEVALTSDAASPDRLRSSPGPYLLDQLYADLTATVGGQTVTVPFARAQ